MAERTVSAQETVRGRHPSRRATPLAPFPTVGPSADRRERSGPAERVVLGDGAKTTRLSRVEGVVSRIGTAPAIALLVTILCVFGLIMVGSASPVISSQLYGSPWAILIRQSLWMGVGAGSVTAGPRWTTGGGARSVARWWW
jgi:hypothetical protein